MDELLLKRQQSEKKRQEWLAVLEKKKEKLQEIRRNRVKLALEKKNFPDHRALRPLVETKTVTNLLDITTKKLETPSIPELQKSKTAPNILVNFDPPKKERKIVSNICVVDIPPKTKVMYSKEIQTTESTTFIKDENENNLTKHTDSSDHEIPEEEENVHIDHEEDHEDEPENIENSEKFKEFLSRTSTLIERSLNALYDPLRDYKSDSAKTKSARSKEKISLFQTYYNEKYTKNNAVTSISWSPKYPELFASSYYVKSKSEYNGNILVWSLYLKDKPEFVFTCENCVSKMMYDTFNHNIIIGGTYSGQILFWDSRRGSDPVARSPLNSKSHTFPIFGMDIIGTQTSYNLVTMSTDGRLCVWTMDKLSQPQEVLDLYVVENIEGSKVRNEISTFALGFPKGELNKFFVGCENGKLYSGIRHESKTGVREGFEGHFGPITGLHCHPGDGKIDFSDLIVTSSMDWSCKLWSSKYSQYLYSFEEYNDYVYDVKWSPQHPALFASVDGTGNFLLWNLNEDLEMPIQSINVCENALNQLSWSYDGNKIALGSSSGSVFVYEMDKEISIPKDDEWKRFEQKIMELQ